MMKKKVVLVVLVGVFAWLLWPSAEDREQEAQQEQAERARACHAETYSFCRDFWCDFPGRTNDAMRERVSCVNECQDHRQRQCSTIR